MKKSPRIALLAVVIFSVLCGALPVTAYAKDMEICYHCGGTGQFYCEVCHNQGEVVCDVCGGAGGHKCEGDTAHGHGCDGGYYTCPSCHGDTYLRNGDGEIPPDARPGSCGACGGQGKLRCIVCSNDTPGWNTCYRCGGAGKQECQVLDCKDARKIGWKCPYCKGTGYLGTGQSFPPEWNDGVHNVPVKGDYIVTNRQTWAGYIYGGGSAPAPTGDPAPGNSPTPTGDPAPTGSPAPGNSPAPGGSSGPDSSPVPGDDPVQSESPVPGGDLVPGEDPPPSEGVPWIPQNRNADFDIPIAEGPGGVPAASARVEIGAMTAEEAAYFAALPQAELEEILTGVQRIVETAQPGRAEPELNGLMARVSERNGYGSFEEGRLFPICFDGGQHIGFPVQITVQIERGLLDGGCDLYVYHVLPDGEIESLGKAAYGTYEDGTVERITFSTRGFSSFFTARAETSVDLTGPGPVEETDASAPAETSPGRPEPPAAQPTEESAPLLSNPLLPVILLAAAAAVAALVTALLRKKRK